MTEASTDDRSPQGPDSETQSRIRQSFLSKLSRTPDKRKRLAILTACARLRAPWVEAVLWEALDDSCEEIRGYIIKTLGSKTKIRLHLALGRLHRPPWYAKSAALKILGQRRVKEAVDEIRKVLDDRNVDIRCSAAGALGDIGGPEAVKLLVVLTKDASSHVRQAAEEALEKASEVRFI